MKRIPTPGRPAPRPRNSRAAPPRELAREGGHRACRAAEWHLQAPKSASS